MAGSIYINLSEEIEQDIISRYQSVCEELKQQLNSISNEFAEICERTHYKPMVDTVNTTINLFDEEIHEKAEVTFSEWCDGEGSFKAAAEKSQSGDEAVGTAGQIESDIRDLFDEFWLSHPMGEAIQTDDSRPEITLQDFDDLKEIYTKCSQEIERIGEDAVNSIKEQGSDDPTYNIMIPAVTAITEPVTNAFEEFCNKIDEAKDECERLKQEQDSKNEEAVETATQTSASAADIAAGLKMYDDI